MYTWLLLHFGDGVFFSFLPPLRISGCAQRTVTARYACVVVVSRKRTIDFLYGVGKETTGPWYSMTHYWLLAPLATENVAWKECHAKLI